MEEGREEGIVFHHWDCIRPVKPFDDQALELRVVGQIQERLVCCGWVSSVLVTM